METAHHEQHTDAAVTVPMGRMNMPACGQADGGSDPGTPISLLSGRTKPAAVR
ncbi:hypothetical protein [Mycobacterium sp. NPDC050441]|uniref:hypothetical protein n=1 Tax=Mycobacterium sp. NPDC050441 TaxID=3155403 RepID=UPI0033C77112